MADAKTKSKPQSGSKLNLVLLLVVLVVAAGVLYNTKYKRPSDAEMRETIVKRVTSVVMGSLRAKPMSRDAGEPGSTPVDLEVANIKLTNDKEGVPLPDVVEVKGDLRAKNPKDGKGTIEGKYEIDSRSMTLTVEYMGETRTLENTFGTWKE